MFLGSNPGFFKATVSEVLLYVFVIFNFAIGVLTDIQSCVTTNDIRKNKIGIVYLLFYYDQPILILILAIFLYSNRRIERALGHVQYIALVIFVAVVLTTFSLINTIMVDDSLNMFCVIFFFIPFIVKLSPKLKYENLFVPPIYFPLLVCTLFCLFFVSTLNIIVCLVFLGLGFIMLKAPRIRQGLTYIIRIIFPSLLIKKFKTFGSEYFRSFYGMIQNLSETDLSLVTSQRVLSRSAPNQPLARPYIRPDHAYQSETDSVQPHILKLFVDAGFPADVASSALSQSHNNISEAIEMLETISKDL
ncbi:hypothetical protein PCE1_002991 [Barthelona sp. PCE]